MKRSKGQAALEFLTTYAWAFLVIGVTIGSLYYFGIFDFGRHVPEQCLVPTQFECADFSMNHDTQRIQVKLTNSIGETIQITHMELTNDFSATFTCTPSPSPSFGSPLTWPTGTSIDLNFTACTQGDGGFLPQERFDAELLFTYYADLSPSQTEHTVRGKVSGRVIGT